MKNTKRYILSEQCVKCEIALAQMGYVYLYQLYVIF